MKTGRRKYISILLILLFVFTACGAKEEKMPERSGFKVYYLTEGETALEEKYYQCTESSREEQIDELLRQLSGVPEGSAGSAPLQMGFSLRDYAFEGDQLVLSLDAGYQRLDAGTEILVRAALVRTLAQVAGVEGVSILVDGQPLIDDVGIPAGMMKVDSFVLNDSGMEDSIRRTELTLYFANENGDRLKSCRRIVEYEQNILPEQLVVEQLIAGTKEEGCHPVIPEDTRILSVTNDEGVCYVNLDQTFLKPYGSAKPEVSLYSIVNSLSELGSVRSVQFLINGESNTMFRELLDLNRQYSRNLDLIEE